MSWADPESLVRIAKVLKSHGTGGGVLLGFRDIDPEDIDSEEPVFIEFDGLPVPFFFESFEPKGTNKAIVRLTGLHDLEDAEEIVGRAVYAEESSLGTEPDEDATLEALIGWQLLNRDVLIGQITDFEDIPGNPCLYVETEKGQVMIPFHEDFILSLDPESEELSMDLPEGLV